MKHTLFFSLFMGVACLLSAVENNWTPDLKSGAEKGLQSIFTVKGKGDTTLQDGVITLKADATSSVFIIDYKMKLEAGTDNTLNFEARGTGTYLCYVEFKNEAGRLMGRLTGTRTAKAEWQKISDRFDYPYNSKDIYFVVMAMKGSEISVRNISITGKKQVRPEDLLTTGAAPVISLAIDKEAKTLPAGFESQGKGAAVCADGALELRSDTADFQRVVMKNLPLVPGGNYRFAYEVKGTGKYGAYVEYRDEKGVIRTANGVFKSASADWAAEVASFVLPQKCTDGSLVLAASNGKVQFRNLSLAGQTLANMAGKGEPSGLLKKGPKNLPEKFEKRGSGYALYTGDSLALLAPAGKASLVIRHNLPLKGGEKYTMKFQVCGLAGNYACYIEYRDAAGKLRSLNGTYQKAPADWKSVQYPFSMPVGCKGAYIVLAGQNDSKVLFRNVVIEGMKE